MVTVARVVAISAWIIQQYLLYKNLQYLKKISTFKFFFQVLDRSVPVLELKLHDLLGAQYYHYITLEIAQ